MWVTFNIVDPIFRICSLLLVKKYIYFLRHGGPDIVSSLILDMRKKMEGQVFQDKLCLFFFCLGIIASAQTDFSLNRQILNIQSFIQYSKESLFQKFVLKVEWL